MNSKSTVKILLVEDSQEDVDLIREALSHSRLEIKLSVMDNGERAMHYLHRHNGFKEVNSPDLIILDLNLPKKNGQEILVEIKKDPALKSIPVVIFTTSRSLDDISKAYGNHTNCYICKPLNLEDFTEAVNKIEDFWFHVVQLPSYLTGDNDEYKSN